MHRQRLADGHGMLFVFDLPRQQRFWMKKTLIDLDIIFISRHGRIVSISENAVPCHSRSCPIYASTGRAQYVVEVNGGFAARHGIAAGGYVRLPSASVGG